MESEDDISALKFKNLVELGPILPGASINVSIPPLPAHEISWFDPKLCQEGKKFIDRNWFGIFLTHLITLMLGITLRPSISIVIRSGKSNRRGQASLKRYLQTTLHTQIWYESNMVELSRDIQKIRRLHAKALHLFEDVPLNLDLDEMQPSEDQIRLIRAVKHDIHEAPGPCKIFPENLNTYEPEIPMNQLMLTLGQFSFMALPVLMPAKFGIHDPQGVKGFCHLWAVLGKSLGIEDEFNLGISPDLILLQRIFRDLILAGLKECDDLTIVFWDSLIYGFVQYVPLITLKSILLFMVQDVIGIRDATNLKKLMTFYDLTCFYLLHYFCLIFLRFHLIRWIAKLASKLIVIYAKWKYL